MKQEPPHPMQPIVIDEHGVPRFKANKIVRYILDHGGIDLNHIAMKSGPLGFSAEDHMQLAQLIGYSIGGYGELDYVTDESYSAAESAAEEAKR
jgi:hypothetical protein